VRSSNRCTSKNSRVRGLRTYVKALTPPLLEPLIKRCVHAKDRDWHKRYVGGWWEEIGKAQFDFLVRQGLRSQNYLLDVGCGSLRGGIHFIRYLEPGRYFGIDNNQDILNAGRAELRKNNLTHKTPMLERIDHFDFRSLRRQFDYALAEGLFTILPLNSIIRCIMNIEHVLVPGGRFYASIYDNPKGKFNLEPVVHARIDTETSYFDKCPYHYDFETFLWVCEGTKLNVQYIGDFGDPRDEQMIVFTKTSDRNLSNSNGTAFAVGAKAEMASGTSFPYDTCDAADTR
jgi:SAM-dependent methyltransferase